MAKDLKDHFIGMNIKQKWEKKNNKCRYFFKPKFVGVNSLFVLVHTNQDFNSKNINLEDIIC